MIVLLIRQGNFYKLTVTSAAEAEIYWTLNRRKLTMLFPQGFSLFNQDNRELAKLIW